MTYLQEKIYKCEFFYCFFDTYNAPTTLLRETNQKNFSFVYIIYGSRN